MSLRAADAFFACLDALSQAAFPDLHFRGHRSARPLSLTLSGEPVRHLRLCVADQCLHLERVECLGGDGSGPARDLAPEATLSASSLLPGTEQLLASRALVSPPSSSLGIHTASEAQAWVCLSFDPPQPLQLLRVFNRDDEWAWRAWGLVVETSTDGEAWTELYAHGERLRELAACMERSGRFRPADAAEFATWSACSDMLAALAADDRERATHRLATIEDPVLSGRIRNGFSDALLVPRQLWWSGHGITRPFRFWSEEEKRRYLAAAHELLADVRRLVPNVCFGFGFVLGYAREGGFIGHDDDLDLIVAFDRASTPTLSAALAQIEDHLRGFGYTVAGDHFNHRWVYRDDWNAVDVFIGLREGDEVSWFPSARGGLRFDDVFPPLDVDLLGRRSPVPRHPFRYLERTYGPRWREPDSGFRHPWDRTQFEDIA